MINTIFKPDNLKFSKNRLEYEDKSVVLQSYR